MKAPRLFPVEGQLACIRYCFFFTYGHMGCVNVLARGKKWMNVSLYCLLLPVLMLRIVSVGLLAWMGTGHKFNRASRRPWATALRRCKFCTPSLPREHPPRDRWPAWEFIHRMCREGEMPLEMGTRLQQDWLFFSLRGWTSSWGQFNYFFPMSLTVMLRLFINEL